MPRIRLTASVTEVQNTTFVAIDSTPSYGGPLTLDSLAAPCRGSMKSRSILKITLSSLVLLSIPFASGCADSSAVQANSHPVTNPAPPAQIVTVSPKSLFVKRSTSTNFSAVVSNATETAVMWSVGEGISGGTITDSGVYTAPAVDGV